MWSLWFDERHFYWPGIVCASTSWCSFIFTLYNISAADAVVPETEEVRGATEESTAAVVSDTTEQTSEISSKHGKCLNILVEKNKMVFFAWLLTLASYCYFRANWARCCRHKDKPQGDETMLYTFSIVLKIFMWDKNSVISLKQQAEEVVVEDNQAKMDIDNSKSFILSNFDKYWNCIWWIF